MALILGTVYWLAGAALVAAVYGFAGAGSAKLPPWLDIVLTAVLLKPLFALRLLLREVGRRREIAHAKRRVRPCAPGSHREPRHGESGFRRDTRILIGIAGRESVGLGNRASVLVCSVRPARCGGITGSRIRRMPCGAIAGGGSGPENLQREPMIC